MAKIGLIINPYSKRIKKLKDPVGFYKKIGSDSIDIRLTHNLDDLIKAAEDFKKQNISYLAISGGDGSIHLVISTFFSIYKDNTLPHILILRNGSMNIIARSFRCKSKGIRSLKKFIKAIDNKKNIKIFYRDTIKVNDMYCFLFGLGFVANFINEFNKGGNKSSLKAIKVLFKVIFAVLRGKDDGFFNRINLKVIVDNKELWIKKYFAIFAATIGNLAICFNLTPRAYEKEKTFHLLASGMYPKEILLRFNKIRRGKPIKHANHYDNIASKLEIYCPGEFIYQMDGDIYKAHDKLSIKAGPKVGFIYV